MFSYDLVRVIALIMVIAVHSLPSNYVVQVISQPLLFCANGIFFILSGHFALRERDGETLAPYYYRKVRSIVLTVIVYTCVLTTWNSKNKLPAATVDIIKSCIRKIFNSNVVTHLWFVYTVFGFLLVAPFIARFTSHANKHEKKWFALLGIGYCTCIFAATITGIDFNWSYPFGLWFFLFCIDPLYYRQIEDRFSTLQLLLAAVACNATLAILCHTGVGSHLFDINPFYIVESICLYVLLIRAGKRLEHNAVISELAKRQFGIFIIHMFMLDRVRPRVPDGLPWPASWTLVILGTLALSYVAVVIIDTLVTHPLQRLLDRLVGQTQR